MKHSLSIWSKRKSDGKSFIIHAHVTVTQEQIEELAVNEYIDGNSNINEDREYWAELDETTH